MSSRVVEAEMIAEASARFRETAIFSMPTLPSEGWTRADFESIWLAWSGVKTEKCKWLIVHPTANLQRERNTFRAAQLWKVIRVSELLTLIGTFYSAGITFERPVAEAPQMGYCSVEHERLDHTDYIEEMTAVPDIVTAIYLEQMAAGITCARPVAEAICVSRLCFAPRK
jgi:hypothetical protein